MRRFTREQDFSALSLEDLLEARDQYHVHIARLDNVVATAVGRYRIRTQDPDYQNPRHSKKASGKGARTLANSAVTKWSWPCVLVFVDKWVPKSQLQKQPEDFVPPRLHMPDGRVVPTCVVYAPPQKQQTREINHLTFPSGLMGGGYPILADEQGEERIGSIGCLVSDGFYTYALTSRHVVGNPGTPMYTIDRGERRRVGIAHRRSSDKESLQALYPGLYGTRTLVNIDAGLLRVDEIADWTSQVYGVGRIGQLINISAETLSLDLVGCPVKAFGGASGEMRGEIQGLFYRYRSVGGTDYVAELLIGPREKDATVTTRPGDSGTLWFWDESADASVLSKAEVRDAEDKTPELRPLALQWGGHSFLDAGGQGVRQFALASSLSTVCRALDVELFRDWSTDHSLYWGKVGHYKIAFSACFLASKKRLSNVLAANAESISVNDDDITDSKLPMATNKTGFIALADVPDLVWRSSRGKDKANHFADMDQDGTGNFQGQTLMELWAKHPESRTPAVWTAFYDSIDAKLADAHRGALPFRVKQIYEDMVIFAHDGDLARYVCAAGVLAHYVGDACQPLHVSQFHHGHAGKEKEQSVHDVYETKMLDRFPAEIVEGMAKRLQGKKVNDTFKGGDAAADAVVRLMKRTLDALDPEAIIQSFNQNAGRNQTAGMWKELGPKTLDRMADGAMTLATIWQCAWIEGKGETTVSETALKKAIPKATLKKLYSDKTFVESDWLRNM